MCLFSAIMEHVYALFTIIFCVFPQLFGFNILIFLLLHDAGIMLISLHRCIQLIQNRIRMRTLLSSSKK